MPPSEEPAPSSGNDAVDWAAARDLLASYIRHRVPAWPDDVCEDLVQEGVVRIYRTSCREPVRNLPALANTVADSVIEDHRRSMRRRQALLTHWARHLESARPTTPGPEFSLGDPMERLYFVTIEYFEEAHAPCADLARQFFSKVSWKEVAARSKRSHDGLRKLWSRCTDRLRDAFRGDDGPLSGWFDE